MLNYTPKEICDRKALRINPAKTCQPVGALYAALGVHNCLPHSHGSQGCVAFHRMYLTRHFKDPVMASSSSFTEGASVFGGGSNLKTAVKNIFDLYVNNSATQKGLLGSKTVNDSMAEFALGQVAMVQNGNWAWSQINGVEGNVVAAEDIKFLPIYTGIAGEEAQGLSVGTENYFAINSKATPAKQEASIAFLEWLFTSDKGKDYVTNQLGFIAPFSTFEEDEKPADPLAKEVLAWMEKDVTSVGWTFAAFPSEQFKNYFGDALLEYVQDSKTWDEVVAVVKDSWKSERAQ